VINGGRTDERLIAGTVGVLLERKTGSTLSADALLRLSVSVRRLAVRHERTEASWSPTKV